MKKVLLKTTSVIMVLILAFSLFVFNCSAAIITDGTKYYTAGDANNDGKLDIRDLIRLKKIAARSETAPSADFDMSGTITADDFVVIKHMLLGIDNEIWSDVYTK